jgi:signal transduction histidine kinase
MARMIPTVWQWLLTAFLMVFIPVILLILATISWGFEREFFVILLLGSLAADVVLVWYGGWCFGTILKAAKRMAAGDLDAKIDTKQLYGSFRSCAEHLNTTSDAAMLAAREKMKSERMKTELITNVSHDIKTPLTSLINYVDLLQKPHTQEEQQQYLDVLARQSSRLKKLIEDLMEMSKASTGNVTTQITDVNATEAVHQALGEFADKLLAAQLTPVVRLPEEPVSMKADGRLAWRVMGNLLSNAVKYAMPGTRLYVDVARQTDQVLISFKNISAEPLNISAEELMERFVRGDASRNTEGSGLGLNIAAGLMEVQRGSMEVLVDGDLFKVTLFFPCS